MLTYAYVEWFLFTGQVTFNTSIFTYNPGEDVNTFKNESFEPIFLDENITFASNTLRQQAEAVCQGDVNCLFDIASTGDTAVGESTKQISVQLESESEELRKLKAHFETYILRNIGHTFTHVN